MSSLRLAHVEVDGSQIPVVLSDEATLDARSLCSAWEGDWFTADRLSEIRAAMSSLPVVETHGRFGPCVQRPSQIVAVGLNYVDHAAESQMKLPSEPICFSKSVHSLCGPDDDIVMPTEASKLDWEAEMGLIVGKYVYQTSLEEARGAIAGYCLANDVSERVWQLEREGQWMKGKSALTFCPTGPWFIPAEELDAGSIELKLSVNGQVRQHDSTASMVFTPDVIIQTLSQYFPFYPGDLVLTGTPEGVGMATGEYLQIGDVIELSAGPLGSQTNRVVSSRTESM